MNQFESLEICIIVDRPNLSMVLMILQDKNMIGQLKRDVFFNFIKKIILVLHQKSSRTLTIKIKLHSVVLIGCMNLSWARIG